MKKFLLLITLLSLSLNSIAQEKFKSNTVVKTNFLNLIAAGPSAAIEFPVKPDVSIMASAAIGKINWGDFGGLMKYQTFTCELRKHVGEFYYGGYAKYINKKVNNDTDYVGGGWLLIPAGKDRYFTGNGVTAGGTSGFELYVSKKINIDFNAQLGYGRYLKMQDQFPQNIPSGNFLDARIAIWVGYLL
jgi:hypothetical protein